MIKSWVLAIALVTSIGLGARPAAAEWFADVFAGLSLTQSHDLKLSDRGIGPATYEDVHFELVGISARW